MKTRLFLATLCLLLLPMFFTSSTQFSAYANGYVIAFGELIPCECEGPEARSDCICDGNSLRTDPNDNQATASNAPGGSGSEILFAIAAVMLWLRIRAN